MCVLNDIGGCQTCVKPFFLPLQPTFWLENECCYDARKAPSAKRCVVVSLFVGKILAEQLNVAAINCAHTVFVDSLRQVSISFFITTGIIIIEDLVFWLRVRLLLGFACVCCLQQAVCILNCFNGEKVHQESDFRVSLLSNYMIGYLDKLKLRVCCMLLLVDRKAALFIIESVLLRAHFFVPGVVRLLFIWNFVANIV